MLLRQFFSSLLLSLLMLQPVQAEPKAPISLQDATQKAETEFGGKVLKTETSEEAGRPVYKIRLVNEGRVKEILIDSQTGEVVKP